jgi:hypothetical protein
MKELMWLMIFSVLRCVFSGSSRSVSLYVDGLETDGDVHRRLSGLTSEVRRMTRLVPSPLEGMVKRLRHLEAKAETSRTRSSANHDSTQRRRPNSNAPTTPAARYHMAMYARSQATESGKLTKATAKFCCHVRQR